jgi:carboxylesterase type B
VSNKKIAIYLLHFIVGLFHKAIIQSATAINSFSQQRSDMIVHLASFLDLKTPNEKEILQRLKALPTEKLFEIYEKVADVSL